MNPLLLLLAVLHHMKYPTWLPTLTPPTHPISDSRSHPVLYTVMLYYMASSTARRLVVIQGASCK